MTKTLSIAIMDAPYESANSTTALRIGAWKQTNPPELDRDLVNAIDKGISVYAIAEDIQDRALFQERLIDGVSLIEKSQVPQLFEQFEYVWHW